MKKIVIFLLCSINLLAYRVVKTTDREVIIYQNRVIINESLILEDDGDRDRIIYERISPNIDINSINLVGGELKGLEFERSMDSNFILKSFLGKEIEVEKNGKIYHIILLDYKENIVGKDIKTGVIYIFNNPDIKFNFLDIKNGNKVVMDVEELGDKINMSYITQGLNLNIYHKLDIDSMKLETWGNIYNDTGVSLDRVGIKIISDFNKTPGIYMMRSSMMDENVSLIESNDRIEYRLKGKYNLSKNNEKNIKLTETKVKLIEKYVYNTSSYSKNPTRVLEIENTGKSAISTGKIYLWKGKEFIDDSNIGFISKGEKYELKLNQNFNLRIESRLKNIHSLGNNLVKKGVEIEIKNNSNEEVNLEINYNQLPEVWTELETREKYEKISNKTIKFKLNLDKNSHKKIIFSFIEEKK